MAFARAARRAEPQCRVLAGIGGIQEGQILDDFERFFAAGGLKAADAIDIHHYPTLRPPEFLEGLLVKLNALMEKHGGRKPIWITEYGYYADDEPQSVPIRHGGFDRPLASEQVQAEYAVRWATIALANGVDKVFYHAGTCPGINADNLEGVFYKYGGQPRKIYAAQAVMASFLTPSAKFVKKLSLGPTVRGYLFRDGQRLVAVVLVTRQHEGRPNSRERAQDRNPGPHGPAAAFSGLHAQRHAGVPDRRWPFGRGLRGGGEVRGNPIGRSTSAGPRPTVPMAAHVDPYSVGY